MKSKKTMISIITAVMTASFSVLSSASAGTVNIYDKAVSKYSTASASLDNYSLKFEDCIKIEDFGWNENFSGKCEAVYMKSNGEHGATFYFVKTVPDRITFSVSKEVDEIVLEQVIKGVDSHLILNCWKNTTTDYYNCTITLKNDEDQYDAIDSNTAKKLYNVLSEYAKSFEYSYDQYEYDYGGVEYLTGYEAMEYDFSLEDKLNEYLEQNNINAKLVKYSDREINFLGKESAGDTIYIVPDNDISIMEHYELAKSIAEETGIRPHGVKTTGLGGNTEGKTIDFADYLAGDANCDGQLDMADAVLIMQSFANPDKYGENGSAENHLTELGKFNADMDGDGLTVGDAQAIQKILLGIDEQSPDPSTPPAQPIGAESVDEVIELLNNYDINDYNKAYRSSYLTMFTTLNADGFIYHFKTSENAEGSIELTDSASKSNIALMPYMTYEDMGILYHVTYLGKDYQVYYYRKAPGYSAENMQDYIKNRLTCNVTKVIDGDTCIVDSSRDGQTDISTFFNIDDMYYCKVRTYESEEALTDLLKVLDCEKLSIRSEEYIENMRKLISDFLTENNMCFSVIPASQMPESLRGRYILLSTNGYNKEDVSLFTVFKQENNIDSSIIKSVPYYLDDDSEINEVREKLFWFVLENDINATLDYVDEAKAEKYDTVMVKYKQSDEEARRKIEAFLDENNIDHKFVEFRDIE